MPTPTDLEIAQIHYYLGQPDMFADENPRLNDAINVIGSRAAQWTLLQGVLADLIALDAAIKAAWGTSGMTGAGNGKVSWGDDNQRFKGLRSEGRRLAGRLSNMLGVEIMSDVFGGSGYQGDGWIGQSQYKLPWLF